MLSLDAAFERIGAAFQDIGYVSANQQKPPESPGDRLAVFTSPNMSVRVSWTEKARLLKLQFEEDGEWVDFTRLSFGPGGLEESAVQALIRAVQNEVGETSNDAG